MAFNQRVRKKDILPIVLLIIIILAVISFFVRNYILVSKMKNVESQTKTTSQSSSVSVTSTPKETVGEKTFTDKNDFYDMEVKYPTDSWDTTGVMTNFVLDGVKKTQDEWKIGGDIYQSEQQLNEQFPDRAKITYQYIVDYKKYSSTLKNTHSYVISTYQFTGGAHGNGTVQTFTFTPNGLLDIQDILDLASDDNAVKLSHVLLEKLKTENPDQYVEGMAEDGLGLSYLNADGTFNHEKCNCDGFNFASNFQKFYVTDNGLTFLFDPYQVAAYAAGVVRVDLDWQTLQPYLKNNF